jgi:hypothetical protein
VRLPVGYYELRIGMSPTYNKQQMHISEDTADCKLMSYMFSTPEPDTELILLLNGSSSTLPALAPNS